MAGRRPAIETSTNINNSHNLCLNAIFMNKIIHQCPDIKAKCPILCIYDEYRRLRVKITPCA